MLNGGSLTLSRCIRGRCAWLFFACAVLVETTLAAGGETPDGLEHVIPPGQEALLADMLGSGTVLPGNCQFTNGNAQGATVTAEYVCAQGSVVFELRFPDDAPPAAPRTEQFAIVVRSGSAPAELVDALVSRIRAHEAGFHWKQLARPPSLLSRSIRLVGVAVAVSGILLLGLAFQFLVRRRLPAAGTWPHSAVGAAGLAVVSAGALCALVHAALRASGTLSSALLWERPDSELLVSLEQLAALVPAAMVAAMCTARLAPRRRLRAYVGVTVISYVVVGYWMSVLPNDLSHFGSLSTLQPNTSSPSDTKSAPSAVVYRTNAFGFREPTFDAVKATGEIRVALIGDSYVYGTGVSEDGTLRARLAVELGRRWPTQRFEVLNLGIPGDNLASHVELFAAALARLDPDAVVLCLTLPNDLSRWDEQVERQDARHLSPFSVARFLTGDAASWLWAALRLETAVTPAGLAHLDEQMGRLEDIRRRSSNPRVLLFFGFHEWDPQVIARLQRIPDIAVVSDGVLGPEDFIPGDGHPTALGNTRSAERIVATLAAQPAWLVLVSAAPDR